MPIDAIDAKRWEGWWSHLLDGTVGHQTPEGIVGRQELCRMAVRYGIHPETVESHGTPLPTQGETDGRHPDHVRPRSAVADRRRNGTIETSLVFNDKLWIHAKRTYRTFASTRWIGRRAASGGGGPRRAQHANVPVVDYQLWKPTFDLLQQYRSGGDLVLQTRFGQNWVRDDVDTKGHRRKVDSIAANYTLLKERLGFDKPLKLLRKTSRESARQQPRFRPVCPFHFLGHRVLTVAHRHYISVNGPEFDRAVAWLGEQYGFAPR